jgi:hypothetical protein
VSERVALVPAIFSRLAMARDVMLDKKTNSRKVSAPVYLLCVRVLCIDCVKRVLLRICASMA